MMGLLESVLVETAIAERERRAASYPTKIRDGADAEALTIDYQCWVAITEWLDTGNFFSFAGGSDPDKPDARVISWPELEAAAERAFASANGRCERMIREERQAEQGFADACLRRARLTVIHRKLQLRRATIEGINAELRADREQRTREAA